MAAIEKAVATHGDVRPARKYSTFVCFLRLVDKDTNSINTKNAAINNRAFQGVMIDSIYWVFCTAK